MSALSAEETARLWSVADVLVPAAGEMPALRDADPDGEWLDRSLAARPDLLDPLRRVLATVEPQSAAEAVRSLYDSSRDDFTVLASVVTGTYYLIPRVRRLIGYPGQTRNPPRSDEAAEELEGVIEQAMGRPSFYRPTPS